MADQEARAIVATALALSKSHPHARAIDVLDLAMQGRHGTSPSFDTWGAGNEPFGDWTDPSSPFGELLRKAFAPDEIDAGAATLWMSDASDAEANALLRSWQTLVIDRFAERYSLWGI